MLVKIHRLHQSSSLMSGCCSDEEVECAYSSSMTECKITEPYRLQDKGMQEGDNRDVWEEQLTDVMKYTDVH